MPRIATVMGWNIENFGKSKYDRSNGGAELIELIAAVIQHNQADIAGFCEIRSNRGHAIGHELAGVLNQGLAGNPWTHQESDQFGKNRKEQYLFVWNTNRVTSYAAFQTAFANPNAPPPNIGFPRQSALDRPPFLGYFTINHPPHNPNLLVAIMHSPAPTPVFRPTTAAANLATVTEFRTQGDTCLLMGDFNIQAPVDATTAGSPGEAAFGPLVAPHANQFDQLLPGDWASSLVKANGAWQGMAVGDCFSSPYDQLFFRQNTSGLTPHNPGVEELISESMNGNYLDGLLAAIHGKIWGHPPASYTNVEEAFQAFRVYVSDHMPVVVEVHA